MRASSPAQPRMVASSRVSTNVEFTYTSGEPDARASVGSKWIGAKSRLADASITSRWSVIATSNAGSRSPTAMSANARRSGEALCVVTGGLRAVEAKQCRRLDGDHLATLILIRGLDDQERSRANASGLALHAPEHRGGGDAVAR